MLSLLGKLNNSLFPEINNTSKTNGTIHFLYVLLYTAVFTGIVYIIKQYNLVLSSGITDLAVIFISAFFIHSLVPIRYRPFIYCVVFIASIFHVFSWVSAIAILLCIGTTAIIIYSSIKRQFKWIYLIVLAIGLAILRTNYIYMPRINLIIPFVGAILMFRLILLMHETKYAQLNENHWLKLSYLFCFPNLSFLFYPIIDYKTYVRSYHADDYNKICNRGIWYLMLAIADLLLYKIVYRYSNTSVSSVHDLYSLLWVLLSEYALIIKMIGLLTMGLGFMVMFGFNMPPPFGNFMLASSFAEYWQKVNVYWKDFVVKIFYYPFYFKYRKKIGKAVMGTGIMLAFIGSYILHAYQRYWLSGGISFELHDLIYWVMLGALVVWNTYRTDKSPKIVTHHNNKSFKYNLQKGANFLIVFFTMMLLWYLWNSASVSSFFYVIAKGINATTTQIFIVVCILIIVVLFYALIAWSLAWLPQTFQKTKNIQFGFAYAIFSLLLAVGLLKPQLSHSNFITFITGREQLHQEDKTKKEVGYYQSIIDTKNDNWEVGLNDMEITELNNRAIATNDLLLQKFKPSFTARMDNYTIVTDSFALRDKEYSLQKPPNTYRFALLGGSYEMGSGVSNNDVFESVAEKKLNDYYKGKKNIEIMNFAVGGYSAIQDMEQLKYKVLQFKPDAILVFAHTGELKRFSLFFTTFIRNATPLKYSYLIDIKKKSGVKQSMSQDEIADRLAPYMKDIYQWCYFQMDSVCKANNIKPVWIYLPTIGDTLTQQKLDEVRQPAARAGFETYVLTDVYGNYKVSQIAVSENDTHPNVLGHRLIADKLFNLLTDSTNHLIPVK